MPNVGTESLPWAPGIYGTFEPWFITYNLVETDMTQSCALSSREQRVETAVHPYMSGTVTMNPGLPKKGETVDLRDVPAPGYIFSHWKNWGVGLYDYKY